MTDMQVFEYQGMAEVRAVVRDGEPWFVAGDVCKVLGHQNVSEAVSYHVDAEDAVKQQVTPNIAKRYSGPPARPVWLINESGLYALIFGSKLDTAKAFKRWITSEVLPSIRKTGGYLSPEVDFTDPHQLMRVLENWAADRERADAAEAKLTIETAKVNELAPKASAFDEYLEGAGELNFRRVMGIVRQINPNIKEQWVSGMARDLGYVEKFSFTATAKAVHAGYLVNKGGILPNGTPYAQGRFTPKGVRWLLKVVLGNGDSRRVSDAMLDEIAEGLV